MSRFYLIRSATALRRARPARVDAIPDADCLAYDSALPNAGHCVASGARDLNHAIQPAARIPPARVGSIEVRPIREQAQLHSLQGGTMQLQPYLMFDGRCEEALEFYRVALGAEVQLLLRFSESPEPPQPGMIPPGAEQKIMHAELRVGDVVVMASDGRCQGKPAFQGFTLALTVATVSEVERIFAALLDGGQVTMPLAATFWSPRFGMVTDRFGVCWMVMVRNP